MRLIGLLLLLVYNGRAQDDPRLRALQVTLEALHAQTKVSAANQGEGPQLMTAKHQLRDWIESQLNALVDDDDPLKLTQRINTTLQRISVRSANHDQNLLGSLGEVRLTWASGLLIVTTQVGIVCEYDASAYAYQRADGKWKRIWQSEQDDSVHYKPQYISAVRVWRSDPNGSRNEPAYIMTLGNEWGCESSWHTVYYRIWRVDPGGSKLLVDQSGLAYLRGEGYIVGSIAKSPPDFSGAVDAIIEFSQNSVDAGVHNREAIRHFRIDGDRVRRADPVALSPRDFVDEWMSRPWTESSEWTSAPGLRAWHKKLHADFVWGSFVDVTMHCHTADLWQVGFTPGSFGKRVPVEGSVYFLIRWTPPYRFRLAGVSARPWQRCTQPDPEADAWRTLFSTQEWR